MPVAAREPSARHLAHAGAVLVDSGPLIALFNGADRWHAPVLDWLRAHPAATLFSTWCVATEVCALLARRIHNDCALDFLRWVQRGGLTLDRAADGSLTEVLRISERFASLRSGRCLGRRSRGAAQDPAPAVDRCRLRRLPRPRRASAGQLVGALRTSPPSRCTNRPDLKSRRVCWRDPRRQPLQP